MEWKCFFAIPAYILTTCDLVLGANTIINVTLVDGETPNEGRVEYLTSDASTWKSACGDGFGSAEASVICRHLGYPGVNNFITQWPFGKSSSLGQERLICNGDEDNLAECSLRSTSYCINEGGMICYESGYIGCYPASAVEELQTPCEYGLDDIQNLTIQNCVSLCNRTNAIYTYAGVYSGSMCLCGNPLTTINQSDKVDDRLCSSSPCAGRNIESCGGSSYIALFNTSGTSGPITASTGTARTTSETDTTTSPELTPTVHAFSETNNPTQSTRELVTTNIYSTSSTGTSTQSETCSPKGVQIGLIVFVVALLLYAVAITFLLIQLRRKVPTRTGENGPDPYMDLQARPEADRTYQEMAITSTASSKKPGESRLPSSNLFYENQNVVQYANKIKKGADYEDVLTPN